MLKICLYNLVLNDLLNDLFKLPNTSLSVTDRTSNNPKNYNDVDCLNNMINIADPITYIEHCIHPSKNTF